MSEIWKFALQVVKEQEVKMPAGAQILCVQPQYGNNPCLWALVNPEAKLEPRKIQIVHTREEMSEGVGIYIGTCQLLNGKLVLHMFDML